MKHIIVFLAAVAAFVLPAAAQQQLKIGILDMERLFGSYYRTVEIREELGDRERQMQMEVEAMRVQLMEYYEQREALQAEVEAPELSPEIRDSKRRQLQQLHMEMASLERQIRQFMSEGQRTIQEQGGRAMRSIFNDLNTVISDVSRLEGYDIVFDKSGTSPQGVPFLLYTDEIADFTDLVIEAVNENAPEGFDPAEAYQGSDAALEEALEAAEGGEAVEEGAVGE